MKTNSMLRLVSRFAMAALVAAACSSEGDSTGPVGDDTPTLPPETTPPATTGNEETTFDHDNTAAADPFEMLDRMAEEGPPAFQARLHSCPKMRYATIGRVLASRGVNLANTAALSAGQIYNDADQALGVANYAARVSESNELTTASAAKLFDIFVAAAPEIIANMPNREECKIGGQGTQMFNASGQCTVRGVSCLIGMPATAEHMELCNQIIGLASTPELGRTIAVAALAAAAHTCE